MRPLPALGAKLNAIKAVYQEAGRMPEQNPAARIPLSLNLLESFESIFSFHIYLIVAAPSTAIQLLGGKGSFPLQLCCLLGGCTHTLRGQQAQGESTKERKLVIVGGLFSERD